MEDQVGGKHIKVEDNDVSSSSNQTGDVRRGAWPTHYRKGGNLQGEAEEKNAMPVRWSGDGSRLHDSSSLTNTQNYSTRDSIYISCYKLPGWRPGKCFILLSRVSEFKAI